MASPDTRTTVVRVGIAATGIGLALASAAWIAPTSWPTYAVFFAFALAYSFVWLDSPAPTSLPHMATATAFVYIAGFPILFFELLARAVAYPVIFVAGHRGWMELPRALRPLVDADAVRARAARRDLAAMLGLATIGLTVRVAVIHALHAAGIEPIIAIVAFGEVTAYGVMGALSAALPLPTAEYVVAAPGRLPVEDERVDVIFSAVLTVPSLVLLITYGWTVHGLAGAAACALTPLGSHGLVQLLIRRRHLLDERHTALERATASLAQKQRQLEDFTYIVTHDMKTPLGSIGVLADRLLDRDTLPDDARADVARILGLAQDAHQTVVDRLEMVRIVSDPETVGPVNLGDVTAQALEALRPQIAARHVRVDVAAPLPVVRGQAVKLRHVVENLIGNAIRFVPPGTGVINIAATRHDAAVVLSVRDNGVGIAAEHHEAIFQMFQHAPDRNGSAAGSGMGLALVKRIVEAHGGSVTVDSAPGRGSVFRISLPAVSEGPGPASVRSATPQARPRNYYPI